MNIKITSIILTILSILCFIFIPWLIGSLLVYCIDGGKNLQSISWIIGLIIIPIGAFCYFSISIIYNNIYAYLYNKKS